MGLTPSFRRPNTVPAGKADESVRSAIQSHDNSITDLNQAIVSLKGQISALGTSSSSSSSGTSSNTTTSTENVTNITNIAGWPVNNQTGVTAYTTAQSDNTTEIIVNDASAIAVTLNQSVTLPWGCFVNNQGTGTATLTPQLGLINGAANLALPGGDFAVVFFDGLNFTALTPAAAGSGVTSVTGVLPIVSSGGTTPAISINKATSSTLGSVEPDNTTITINGSGVISATGLPVNNPTFTGKMTGPQFVSNSSAPTVAPGSAAGVGASVSGIIGTDAGGQFTLTTGTGTTTGALCTVTFANAYPTGAFAVVQGQNGAALAVIYVGGISAGSIGISALTALSASSSYVITYIVSGF